MQCAGGRQIDAWRGAGEQQAESLRRCRSAAAALLPILAADRSCRTALGAPKEGAGTLKAQARRKARTGDGLDGCGWPGGAAGSAGRGRGGSPNNSVSVFGLTESKTHGHPIQLPHHPPIPASPPLKTKGVVQPTLSIDSRPPSSISCTQPTTIMASPAARRHARDHGAIQKDR